MIRLLLGSGLGLMILSALFFASTDILLKFISPVIPATEIAFFRFLIGGVILWSLISSSGAPLKGTNTRVLLIRGLFGTLSFFFFLKTIAMIPLANAMVLMYTFPVFAAFFSFLIFREPIGRLEIALIIIGLIGIYILINPGARASYNLGYAYGLLAGCFSGLAVVLIRKLRETNGPLIIYFYFCLVGGVMSFPFFVREFRMPSIHQLLILTIVALILLVGQILMTHGFRFCKAAEGSVILMSEVVFAGLAGVLVFNDSLSPSFLTGAFLIIGSGIGLNLVSRRLSRSVASLEP